jgi:hypothetical protein
MYQYTVVPPGCARGAQAAAQGELRRAPPGPAHVPFVCRPGAAVSPASASPGSA